jgi:hypothetical protein
MERAEIQAWRRAQLVFAGSVADRHVVQIDVGDNSRGVEVPRERV